MLEICTTHMNTSKVITRTPGLFSSTRKLGPNFKWVHHFHTATAKYPVFFSSSSTYPHNHQPMVHTSEHAIEPDVNPGVSHNPEHGMLEYVEVNIEKVIYGCRFFAILAVWGSLVGSSLCFFKGCTHIVSSFQEYFVDRAKVMASLVEAIDVYLLGTVMLVFGMGLYELFISNLDKAKSVSSGASTPYRSNLFGMFTLKERPRWLEIKTVNELKTKLGHVIVMLLLIGLFDKSKKAAISTPLDLLCFAASVFLSSGCLFLLSKLN